MDTPTLSLTISFTVRLTLCSLDIVLAFSSMAVVVVVWGRGVQRLPPVQGKKSLLPGASGGKRLSWVGPSVALASCPSYGGLTVSCAAVYRVRV